MTTSNVAFGGKHWRTLRQWIDWGIRRSKWEALTTGAILPIIECVFVNLATGTTGSAWPFITALVVLAAIHLVLLILQLWPNANYPFQCVAEAVEAEGRISNLEQELARRHSVYNTLRSAIDMLNLQTCQIDVRNPDAFTRGIHPIVAKLVADPHLLLGVKSNEFTIELYCKPECLHGTRQWAIIGGLRQQYFFNIMGVDPCAPIRLGNRSPCMWGWNRGVPGVCNADDDVNFFGSGGQTLSSLYFRNVCTVPVYQVCSPNIIGVLVLTSRQEDPFASDVLETMQFISSLISQYIASHNRCVLESTNGAKGLLETCCQ